MMKKAESSLAAMKADKEKHEGAHVCRMCAYACMLHARMLSHVRVYCTCGCRMCACVCILHFFLLYVFVLNICLEEAREKAEITKEAIVNMYPRSPLPSSLARYLYHAPFSLLA